MQALLRPGRIDRKILVPPPDAASRQQIIENSLRNIPCGSATIDVPYLVDKSAGFSGAEVVAICSEACMLAVEDGAVAMSMAYLETSVSDIKPQITPKMIEFYKEIQSNFVS